MVSLSELYESLCKANAWTQLPMHSAATIHACYRFTEPSIGIGYKFKELEPHFQAFALSHEMGHHILHSKSILANCDSTGGLEWWKLNMHQMEFEADEFALIAASRLFDPKIVSNFFEKHGTRVPALSHPDSNLRTRRLRECLKKMNY